MQEIITLFLGYLRGVWKYRWVVVVAAWGICTLGWLFVLKMDDQFESNAKVHVDTQSILKPLLKDLAVDLNVRSRVALLTKTLLNRSNLEKVIRMADLDLSINTPEQLEDLIAALRKDIKLKAERRENIYTLSYSTYDPQLAQLVVRSMLSIFEESALGDTRQDTDSAQRFLEDKIEAYRKNLVEKENRLKEFKRRNVGFLPGDTDYYQKLQLQTDQRDKTQLLLLELENRRGALKVQVRAEVALSKKRFEGAPNSVLQTSVDDSIERAETTLEALLLNFTEKHPDVVTLTASLKELKKKQQAELKTLKESFSEVQEVADNPVLQQMKISLSETEAGISVIRARVRVYQEKVLELQEQVDTVPRIEAELKDLDRDYGVTKNSYEEFLAGLESLKLAESIDKTANNVKFNVVEPPIAPLKPSGPKRLIFLSIVLTLGVGAGVGLAFLISQIRTTYDQQQQLTDDFGLPVLGSVAMVWSTGQVLQRRVSLFSFLMGFGGLLGVYGAIIGLLVTGTDLPGIVQNLLR